MIAYWEVSLVPESWDDLRSGLTIVGLVGMHDPLREGVPESVSICKEAGIKVRMVTGDNQKTAVSLAKEAGILPHGWHHREGSMEVMSGREFREMVRMRWADYE